MIFFIFLCSNLLSCFGEKTILEWKRKAKTCDAKDVAFQDGTTNVAFAYTKKPPASPDNSNIQMHDVKNIAQVRFFSSPPKPSPITNDTFTFDIVMNNLSVPFNDNITGPTTTYYCKAISLPATIPSSIIRFEPLIQPKSMDYVHHILIYDCPPDVNSSIVGYQNHCFQYGRNPTDLNRCIESSSVIATWAVGGGGVSLPENMGLPMGPNGSKLVVIEIHYNNPQRQNVVDSSGIRLYYTHQLRPIEAGILNVGIQTDRKFIIPPGLNASVWKGWCPADCTASMLPPEGINVIGTFLHGHTATKQISFRHIRDGKEIRVIADDPYYDFNFQDYKYFDEPIVIYPYDTLLTTCVYDTSTRTKNTMFGFSTLEEMCMSFSIYYPKLVNVPQVCMYGNYTALGGPNMAFCGTKDGNLSKTTNINTAFTPLPVPQCVYSAPDSNRITPVVRDIKNFNASKFDNSVLLNSDYRLYWSVNALDANNSEMWIALEVNTSGWIGFGLSPTGKMMGSDVNLGWVTQDQVYHADRFADKYQLPSLDPLQDYYDVVGYVSFGSSNDSGDNSFWSGKNVGIVVGSVLVGVFILVSIVYYCFHKKSHELKPLVLQ